MFSQSTRLELTIVAAVLVVLFVCRQPPKSGNAGPHDDAGPMVQTPTLGVPDAQPPAQEAYTPPLVAGGNPSVTPLTPSAITNSADMATTANTRVEPLPPPPSWPKRMGTLDTRNCPSLAYRGIRYGEVTVRWVWDGQKRVPHTVLEVQEDNGTVSIWDFNNHTDGIVISELPSQTP